MTEHESIKSMLALAAAAALDAAELRRVEQHIRTCDVCSQELTAWGVYASSLPSMPPPVAPHGLLERTRARVIEQRSLAVARRRNNLKLAALVVFGWAASLASWILVRLFAGGALPVLGVNLVSAVAWSLLSTAFVWMTAATAAAVLGKTNELARTL